MPRNPEREPHRYQQIADELRAEIVSKAIAPGTKLPSESKLRERFSREGAHLSTTVIRQALDVLKSEGLVVGKQGVGVVVREFRPIRRPAVQRLSSEVWYAGRSIWDVDLEDRPLRVDVEVARVDPPERIRLALDHDGPAWRRSRAFYVEDKPVQLAISHVPADLADDTPIAQTDAGPGGSYARLADAGHAPVRFREEVRTRMPTPDEINSLKLAPGTPVFEIVRLAVDADDRVVEINEMVLDGAGYILSYVFSA